MLTNVVVCITFTLILINLYAIIIRDLETCQNNKVICLVVAFVIFLTWFGCFYFG